MVKDAVHALLAEPRAPQPPKRVWRDWALVAVLVPTAVLEGILREDSVWRPLSIVLVAGLAFTLLWRRTSPLVMVAVTLGTIALVDIAAIVAGVQWETPSTTIFVLVLIYALFRWGSGREATIGLTIMVAHFLLLGLRDVESSGDAVGGAVVFLFPAVLGASVRYQNAAQRRRVERMKLEEREQLARELHDTVAHHVSAIAVQAQAGRTLAGSRPEAAVDALEVIEEEASRTLAEMRSMVGALRQGEEPELAPQPGVADIERLGRNTGARPRVDVELSGDLDDLRPIVDSAVYRLAQESVTNAVRHARHATRVSVEVVGEHDCVRLIVADDGDPSSAGASASSGFGLVGMTERAKLLGGTVEAGPNPDRGWTVSAVLPRNGTGP